MTLTSAEAAKVLRKLNDDYSALLEKEVKSREFCAAVGEDPESVRPDYDYRKVQSQLEELALKIRKLKHAINLFNTTQVVPGFDMTIDEMLVYIPQLSKAQTKLGNMRLKLPKARVESQFRTSTNIIDYTYINYDLEEVEADYTKVCNERANAQLALDKVNNSVKFEVEL